MAKTDPKDTAPATGAAKTDAPAKPKPGKRINVTEAEPDFTETPMDENGNQIDEHGLPLNLVARAMALAAAGPASDPAGLVTDEMIAAHDPVAAQADKDAIAKFHEEKAAAAATDTQGE